MEPSLVAQVIVDIFILLAGVSSIYLVTVSVPHKVDGGIQREWKD